MLEYFLLDIVRGRVLCKPANFAKYLNASAKILNSHLSFCQELRIKTQKF